MKRPKHRMLSIFAATLALSLPAYSFAADGDKPADHGGNKPTDARPARPGAGRFGGFAQDPMRETVAVLGDLSLSPDFELTKDQKQKIQGVRDDFKKQQEKWRADHADDLKKLQDQMAELRSNGGGADNREKFQEIAQARQQLMATGPNAEEASTKIKAVLTADQAKQFEAKDQERKAEMERLRQQFPGAGGRGPRPANRPGATNTN